MLCIQCGYEYGVKKAGCDSCASQKSCASTHCPQCGYRSVPETGLSKLLTRLLKGKNSPSPSRLQILDEDSP